MINSIVVHNPPLLSFSGRDRAKCLQNLCTQDVIKLQPGNCSELFVTSPQGKILGFANCYVLSNQILLNTTIESLELCVPHFAKYTIFDEVEFHDLSTRMNSIGLYGFGIEKLLSRYAVNAQPGQTYEGSFAGIDDCVIVPDDRLSIPGSLVFVPFGQAMAICKRIIDDFPGLIRQSDDHWWNRLRVLSGWPLFGPDIRGDNLPQEVDRDSTAISFHKGCYLGQETVARLDALGHVNRMLMGCVIESDHVPIDADSLIGLQLLNESGQAVGEVRSAVSGEHSGQVVAIVLVRLKALQNVLQISDVHEVAMNFMNLHELRTRFAPLVSTLLESA